MSACRRASKLTAMPDVTLATPRLLVTMLVDLVRCEKTLTWPEGRSLIATVLFIHLLSASLGQAQAFVVERRSVHWPTGTP